VRENDKPTRSIRFRRSRTAAVAAALFLSIAAPRVYAQIRIAVVDMQRALLETDQGRIAKNQLKGLFQKRQEELDHRQQALKQLRDQIERDRTHLDEATLRQRMESYQKQFADLGQSYTQYQQELAEREAELTKQIYVNLQSVIRQLSQQEGITTVFEQAGVVWSRQDLDMTDRVVQAYNQQYPASRTTSSGAPAGSTGARNAGAATPPAANPHPRGAGH
jgi:outer membrane protein